METGLLHQNVSGLPLSLQVTQHGSTKLCQKYSVEKRGQMFHKSFNCKILSGCFIMIAVCLTSGSVIGSGISIVACLVLLYSFVWEVQREDLLVIETVGIQFTAAFRSGQQVTCFIPWHHVKDVFIIEAISMQRVLYNLVVYTESCEDSSRNCKRKLIPLFQGTKPRLACLEQIYRSIHNLLPNQNQ